MSLGGILGSAMMGGGQALQETAQSRIQQKREKALEKVRRDAAIQRDERQAELDQATQSSAIQQRGEQDRESAEHAAMIAEQYGGAGQEMTANQRDFETIRGITNANGERAYSDQQAVEIIYGSGFGRDFLDYYNAIPPISDMNPSQRRQIQDQLEEQGMDEHEWRTQQAFRLIDQANQGRSATQPRQPDGDGLVDPSTIFND